MADYFEEDEDAKADELPSDEEGDAITGKNKSALPQPQQNKNKKPKTPPPVFDNFSYLQDAQNISPDIDTRDIMAFSPDSMQMEMEIHKHVPSKTMPISIPQFWICSMCTFAENELHSPVCSICGALPPMDKKKKKKKKKKKMKEIEEKKSALSPRAYQPNHHQHEIWQQQTRQRHNNHNSNHGHNAHLRTVSEQIPQKAFPISQILPNFLEEEEDEKDDSQQPSYMKKNSIANLVTKNNAISVLNEIPQQEKDLIIKQINKISNKKELQIELYSVKMTLIKKIKFHKTRIIALNKQLNKLRSEYFIQKKLWNEYYIIILQKLCHGYFNKLFNLISTRIEIEKYYLQCFELKLEKVSFSYDKLDETIDEWDINDTREYVKTTMFTISKIRTSPDVHKKKQSVDKMKASITKMEKKYEEKKELLNKSKVDNKKRSAFITLYLKTVIDEFNANNKNIKLTQKYFCKADVQENFNSFLLDQRVECGKIVRNWLNFLLQNINKEILFKDIYIFIERLINTFCKLYGLEQITGKYNYREYCMRFTYPSILNLQTVDKILQKIANTEQGKKEYILLSQHAEYTLFTHYLRLKYKLG